MRYGARQMLVGDDSCLPRSRRAPCCARSNRRGGGTEPGAMAGGSGPGGADATSGRWEGGVLAILRQFVVVLRTGDDAALEQAVVQLSKSHRWLAPVGPGGRRHPHALPRAQAPVRQLAAHPGPGAPGHVDLGRHARSQGPHPARKASSIVLRGPVLIPIILAIASSPPPASISTPCSPLPWLGPGAADIRPAFAEAHGHLAVIMAWGMGIGFGLGFATMVMSRWGRWPFALAMGIVVGIMMFCYLAVPSRLIGIKPTDRSRRDKLAAAAIGGALGAVVCSPPYLLGRIGILMLGRAYLFVPGLILLIIGLASRPGRPVP